jgi:hypothetical protein
MSVFPQIAALQDKVNSPELEAQLTAYGEEYYADAKYHNLLIKGMLELFDAFQLSGGKRISKTVPGTNYLINLEDYDKLLLFTSNTPVTVTVPAGIDINIIAFQEGNGQVSFVGAAGVLVSPPIDSYAKTEVKGAIVALIRTDVNKFRAIGKLAII